MAKFALLVELKAKPGKESEVEAFLEKEAIGCMDKQAKLANQASARSRHSSGRVQV
jgi:hypothetical protein